MSYAIAALEAELATVFDEHQQAAVITSQPGLGPVLGARVLGELGDDPRRFADTAGLRSFAGTAPITRASGRSLIVTSRRICNRRLGDACHWWAFAAITKSPGARGHYDRRRAAGDTHNAALRNLANKLLAKLWHCLQTGTLYNEATPTTSRCSTTAAGCTQRSVTAPRTKPSPTTAQQPPLPAQQPRNYPRSLTQPSPAVGTQTPTATDPHRRRTNHPNRAPPSPSTIPRLALEPPHHHRLDRPPLRLTTTQPDNRPRRNRRLQRRRSVPRSRRQHCSCTRADSAQTREDQHA